jgi:hypothetical protein
MQFDKPHRDKIKGLVIRGEGEQAAFSIGPALKIELVHSELKDTHMALRIFVNKADILNEKKIVFHDDILKSDFDGDRLKKYFQENIASR